MEEEVQIREISIMQSLAFLFSLWWSLITNSIIGWFLESLLLLLQFSGPGATLWTSVATIEMI